MKKFLLAFYILVGLTVSSYAWQNIVQQEPYNYKYINSAATTVVKASSVFLHTIVVNGGTAGTISVYNSPSGATEPIAIFDSTNALETYTFDVAMASGCTVVTSAATKLTVSFI